MQPSADALTFSATSKRNLPSIAFPQTGSIVKSFLNRSNKSSLRHGDWRPESCKSLGQIHIELESPITVSLVALHKLVPTFEALDLSARETNIAMRRHCLST